jgi:hypothetical protein
MKNQRFVRSAKAPTGKNLAKTKKGEINEQI